MPKLSLNASKKTKHTPAGEIPVDWAWAKISDLGLVQTGRQKSPSFSKGTLRPYLRVANVLEGRIDLNDVKWMKFTDDEYEQFELKTGDILLNEGQSLELVGRAAQYNGEPESCCFQNTLIRFRAGTSISSAFALNLFHFYLYTGRFASIASQTTSIAHLGTSRFAALPAPLPPRPEQRRIAEVLGTWDRAIETLESLIAAKERRKQALMQQLLTGRKRLPGFKGKLMQAKLSELLVPHLRPTPKPSAAFLSAGIRSHGRGVFLKQDFEPADIMLDELFEIQTGDLIVNITFAWEGAIAIVPLEANGALVSHRFPTFRFNQDLTCAEFFRHVIRTHDFVFACGLASPGGAGRNRVLSKKSFLKITIPCPSLEEQQAVAAVLDTADRELTLHRQHLATLRTQKRGLMGQLLTGRVRVKTA
ncbi:MAG: restriction endonuclease subunit S [Akkermansiaceae bacterium]|nr:restriction endonuclease subunit S [Akkermansiaceae bacterium]